MRTHGGDPMRGCGRWMAVVVITAALGLAGCSEAAPRSPWRRKGHPRHGRGDPQPRRQEGDLHRAGGPADRRRDRRNRRRAVHAATRRCDAEPVDDSPVLGHYLRPRRRGLGLHGSPAADLRPREGRGRDGGRSEGTEAVLSGGPPVGTTVVSIGVIELWGAELGVGK